MTIDDQTFTGVDDLDVGEMRLGGIGAHGDVTILIVLNALLKVIGCLLLIATAVVGAVDFDLGDV